MSCPSRFELGRATAAALADERTSARAASAGGPAAATAVASDLQSHLAWCPRCRATVDELAAARRELLGKDEASAARTAARWLAREAEARRAERRRGWLLRLGLALAPACALGGLLVWTRPAGVSPSSGAPAHVRAKGALAVDLYCKRGDEVFPGRDGADFLTGDRLRFAYTTAEAGYLVVFGVDDRGGVFPYYPAQDLSGVKLQPGEKVLLPGSIELDGHHGWERAFALWSPHPFDDAGLRARIGDGLRAVRGDLRQAGRLPIEAAQVSFLLRRP